LSGTDEQQFDRSPDVSTPGGEPSAKIAVSRDGTHDDGVDQDGPLSAPPRKPVKPWVRVVEGLVGLAILVLIFVGVFPQFANYSEAWAAIGAMDWWWWAAIVVAAALNLVSYVWPYQAVLPKLRFWDGFTETETTAAISNTVPLGSAISLGMTYRMFGSFGYSPVAISAAVVATGLWNQALKLALPIVAVILLVVTGQSTGGVVGLALFGLLVLAVAAVVVWLVFRSERGAHAVGRIGDRWWARLLRLFRRHPASVADRIERSVVTFRGRTIDVVQDHAGWLTVSVLASQLAVFVVLLISVRAVGIPASQVSFAAVLLAFAIARLVGAIPITPGGLGTTDLALTSVLTAFGANSSAAFAADMVWRAATYFPPIFIGVVTYLLWRRRETQRSRALVAAPAPD